MRAADALHQHTGARHIVRVWTIGALATWREPSAAHLGTMCLAPMCGSGARRE